MPVFQLLDIQQTYTAMLRHWAWVNVGPPSAKLAHIQRGVKQNTVTQYWEHVGLAS